MINAKFTTHDPLIERIARELYRMQSYSYESDGSMGESSDRIERLHYDMAKKAAHMTLSAIATDMMRLTALRLATKKQIR